MHDEDRLEVDLEDRANLNTTAFGVFNLPPSDAVRYHLHNNYEQLGFPREESMDQKQTEEVSDKKQGGALSSTLGFIGVLIVSSLVGRFLGLLGIGALFLGWFLYQGLLARVSKLWALLIAIVVTGVAYILAVGTIFTAVR